MGLHLHEKAIAVLNELLKKKKMLVLLTNAPRPNKTVQNFLEKMGMDKVLQRSRIYLRRGSIELFEKILLIEKVLSHRSTKRF